MGDHDHANNINSVDGSNNTLTLNWEGKVDYSVSAGGGIAGACYDAGTKPSTLLVVDSPSIERCSR